MKITCHSYSHDADYERVSRFLVKTYSANANHINWLQPRWEYMHHHPYIRGVELSSIGVWEAEGEIVAVVHLEHNQGRAYFEIDPYYVALKREMLVYAEEYLCSAEGEDKALTVYINDKDDRFQDIATERGYQKQTGTEEMSHFVIPDTIPAIELPEGFRLKSLAEDNDLQKLSRILFRGFNHGAEPPDDGVAEQEFMQTAPNYRKDLNVVVEAPDGNFAAYCGMWYEAVNRIAYVEPVCTDPSHRRLGVGSAAVLEGIRLCGEQGATVAYVGAVLPIYLSIGFRQIFNSSAWRREWTKERSAP